MKNIAKMIAAVVTLAATLALAGCGASDETSKASSPGGGDIDSSQLAQIKSMIEDGKKPAMQ